jgi:hypothetical protein
MTDEQATPGVPCPQCRREGLLGDDQPTTHCEWCGAEYPIPEQDAVPGKAPAGADLRDPGRESR